MSAVKNSTTISIVFSSLTLATIALLPILLLSSNSVELSLQGSTINAFKYFRAWGLTHVNFHDNLQSAFNP